MYLGHVSKSTDEIIISKVKDIINGLTFKRTRHLENINIEKNTKIRLKQMKNNCQFVPNNTLINDITKTGIV